MALIREVINDAKVYSGELLEEARNLVATANNVAEGRAFVNVPPFAWVSTPGRDLEDITTEFPAFTDAYLAPIAAVTETELLPGYIPILPEFPDAPREMNMSSLFREQRPQWDVPKFTEGAPSVNALSLPATPDIVLPEAPEAAENRFTVPTVAAPTFDDALNVAAPDTIDVTDRISSEFVATSAQLVEAAEAYSTNFLTTHCPNYHAGMAALEARIAEALEGGNALKEGWEQAVYDRAVIRVNDESHRAQQEVTESYARRGFALPPGAVMSALSRIQHEGARNKADVSAQIAAERAKIELQHLQFGMSTSAMLRQAFASAMQGYMQLIFTANGQALQYAFEVGKWAAELFNQRVELYELERARYLAEAEVYSVRLESAFAIIKVFETEIEAEKLKLDVDRNAIALYEAKISGERAKVDLYNGQMEGIRTQLQAEAQKIAVFESQVRAYAARVGGKEAEYNAYRAAVQGDAARVDAYQVEVQAYGHRVQAIGSQVDAERAMSQSIADYNQSIIAVRDGDIRRYLAEVEAEGKRYDSSLGAYKAALVAYGVNLDARVKFVTTRYEKDRLELQAEVARTENILKAQMTNVDGFIKSIAAQADITNAGGSIIGQMASSALTTNNTVVTSVDDT